MSAGTLSVHRTPAVVPYGAPTLIFWMILFALLPIAALFGGMRFLLVALAAGLAVIVWTRPQEAPGAGMLFLFAVGILLPYGARFDPTGPIWQMYYWAAGLLIITLAAIVRIGLGRIWKMPRSAKVFVLVTLAAALYGIANGAAASYVLRQLYGALLLIAYLAIALHVGDLDLLLRRIQTFGVLCAICFFVYYMAVFAEYGFHKEMGFNGTQASFLATPLFIAGVEHKKRSRILSSLAILLVPTLIFMRKDILTFLMALPVAVAIRVKSKVVRGLCYGAIAMVALPALYPPVAALVAEGLRTAPLVGPALPLGVRDAKSLVGRAVQLSATLETVRVHPWLGAGMGGELEVVDPFTGLLEVHAYEDNGWGYLMQKTGILGAAAFLWLLVTMLRGVSRGSVALSACLLSAILVTMFSEPVFFHFTTAPYLGAYGGLLLAQHWASGTR